MKKLKKLMVGYIKRVIGNYLVEKQVAHYFDKNHDYEEQFCYIYNITKL